MDTNAHYYQQHYDLAVEPLDPTVRFRLGLKDMPRRIYNTTEVPWTEEELAIIKHNRSVMASERALRRQGKGVIPRPTPYSMKWAKENWETIDKHYQGCDRQTARRNNL